MSGDYKLVSETLAIDIPEMDTVVDYELPEPMKFKAGDCIGWSHRFTGTMDFDVLETGGSSEVRWKYGVSDDDKGTIITFPEHGLRTYSYTVRYQPEGIVKPYAQCSGDRQTGGSSSDEMCVSSSSDSPISCDEGQCRGQAAKNDKCRSGKYSGSNHKGEYVCKTGLVCRGYVDGTKWGACEK